MSPTKLFHRQSYRIGVALALVLTIAALANFSPNPADGRATAQVAPPTGSSNDSPVAAAPAASSLMIVENAGQWDDGARFQVWGGPAGTMWLAEDGIWLTVVEPEGEGETSRQGDKVGELGEGWLGEEHREPAPRRAVAVKLSFVGANPHPLIETYEPLDQGQLFHRQRPGAVAGGGAGVGCSAVRGPVSGGRSGCWDGG